MQRRAPWILLVAALVTALALHYTVSNLGINTDTEDMLSERLQWRQDYDRYKELFPQYVDTIVVAIDAPTPDQAQDAARALAQALEQRPELYEDVYRGEHSEFFRRQGLLYLEPGELEDLADNLARAQPFLSRLGSDQSLRGLFALLTDAIEHRGDAADIDLAPALSRINATLEAFLAAQPRRLSWQSLIAGDDGETRALLVVKPKIDFGKLFPGESALKTLRALALDLDPAGQAGIRVRLTGGVALAYDELNTALRGSLHAGLLAAAMVMVVLMWGLRSLSLVLASLLTLIVGLSLTAAFATAAIGTLNLISIAFAVLYIGLGVDFAIHFCLRYRELMNTMSGDRSQALIKTSRHVGGSLLICAMTTAVGFFAFIPTAYAGVAELGLISGVGMFISLVVSLTVLPALLSVLPLGRLAAAGDGAPGLRTAVIVRSLVTLPARHPRIIAGTALGLAVLSLLLVPRASFDANPLNLQNPEAESVTVYRELLTDRARSPWSLVVIAHDTGEARRITQELERLAVVDKAVMLPDFVPADQDLKMAIIEDMSLVLGPDLGMLVEAPEPGPDEEFTALRTFLPVVAGFTPTDPTLAAEGRRLEAQLDALARQLTALEPAQRRQAIDTLRDSLLGSLPGRIDALRASLEAEPFGLDGLAADLVKRWRTPDGHYRVEIFPRDDLNDDRALREFVTQVRERVPAATDTPVVQLEAGDAVVVAFAQALISALVVIALLLYFLLRHKGDVLLVLLPLLLAALLTGAASVVLDIPFNFANVIALPLLLGIGVDSGVHIAHRFRSSPPADGLILKTSTARGVVFSTLTTACSFGNLAFSPHAGTASMGIMLSVGVVFTLLCTLMLLPSILSLSQGRRSA